MTTIRTDLRETTTMTARRVAYEPTLPVTATNVEDAINQAVQLSGIAPVPTPIIAAMSPYNVLPLDRVLLVDTSGGPITINMLAANLRSGLDLDIKDDTGNAEANPISVVMAGGETTDGLNPYPIDSNFAAIRFVPQVGGYYVGS